MFMQGGLLYQELLKERQCREPVIRETRRGEVFAPAHDARSGKHFSEDKTNEFFRNAFSRQTTSDIGRQWQSCRRGMGRVFLLF